MRSYERIYGIITHRREMLVKLEPYSNGMKGYGSVKLLLIADICPLCL